MYNIQQGRVTVIKEVGGYASNTEHIRLFWKMVWASKAHAKIKTFIWTACSNSLPTRMKLFDRKISPIYSYLLCQDEAEIVWSCAPIQAPLLWLFKWISKNLLLLL